LTTTAWRIDKAKHAATSFKGEGARRSPGRWNERGTAVVYAASSRALAALEMLVHLSSEAELLNRYVMISATLDEKLCQTLAREALPPDWASLPSPSSTQKIGTEWVASRKSAALAVPSPVIPSEMVYLLNPAHPDSPRIQIGKPEPFQFDPRLLRPLS
jgi:RES domain-containing protein